MDDRVWETDSAKPDELFQLMEKSGKCIVGWIHSHPQWESFLSSVDMHMQWLIQKDIYVPPILRRRPQGSPGNLLGSLPPPPSP